MMGSESMSSVLYLPKPSRLAWFQSRPASAGCASWRSFPVIRQIILVDAIQTADGRPGDIYHLHPHDLRTSLHSGSAHDLSLSGALQLGRKLGMDIPEDSAIKIIAIQAKDVRTLEEKCYPHGGSSHPPRSGSCTC